MFEHKKDKIGEILEMRTDLAIYLQARQLQQIQDQLQAINLPIAPFHPTLSTNNLHMAYASTILSSQSIRV